MYLDSVDSSAREENAGLRDKMLPKVIEFLYKDHVTNEEVRRKIQEAIEEYYDGLLTMVKKQKLRWFVSRYSGLTKTILQGTVNGKGGRVKRHYQKVDRNSLCHFSTRAAEDR